MKSTTMIELRIIYLDDDGELLFDAGIETDGFRKDYRKVIDLKQVTSFEEIEGGQTMISLANGDEFNAQINYENFFRLYETTMDVTIGKDLLC